MRWSALASGICVAACGSPGAFPCNDDGDCGAQGVCTQGYCAFPDTDCPSGLRFGEFASPNLAGACVDPTDTDTDGDGSSGSPSATVTSPTDDRPSTSSTNPGPEGSSTGTPVDDASSTTADSCPPDWWDCAWSHRVAIAVVWDGEALADFPVHVTLTDARIDFAVAAPDGSDVRLVQGGGLLDHEIVAWGRGAAELWVRVPELGSDAPIHLYHGNASAADGSNAAAVWSNGYTSVLHMLDESDVLGLLDLSAVGVEPAPGLSGNGLQFDGATAYLQDQGPPLDVFSGGATVSIVFNATGWGEGGFGRLLDAADINTTATGYSISVAMDGDGGFQSLRFGRGHTVNRGTWYTPDESVALDTWVVAAASYEDVAGSDPTLWVGGQSRGLLEAQVPDGDLVPPSTAVTIGALGTTELRFFDGVIDEIHLATLRSEAWIAAEQLSFTDQLLTFGDVESH